MSTWRQMMTRARMGGQRLTSVNWVRSGQLVRPQFIVSAQNTWFTQPAVPGTITGVDTVITISGTFCSFIGAPSIPDFDAFCARTQTQCETRFQAFLNGHPDVSGQTPGIILMDIEDPHPTDLWTLSEADQDRFIAAFKTRAAAARTKFPKAKLGFYGTLVPDGQARYNDVFNQQAAALERAGRMGMYDNVDYLIPIVYPRFGPTDANYGKYRAMTEQGVDASRRLLTSDNRTLPLLPVLGPYVANGNSNHDEEFVADFDPTLESTIMVQLDVLAEKGVRQCTFWVANDADNPLVLPVPNPTGRSMRHYAPRRQ